MKKERPKKHLLIVGGTGFIGRHLAQYTINKKRWKVTCTSTSKLLFDSINGVKYIHLNITKQKDIKIKLNKNFTHIVNLSGYNSNSSLKREKNKISNINFKGSYNLSNFFFKRKIKKFIQIGSSAEYGNVKSPLDENKKCFPNSSYGKSKLQSTNYLLKMFKTNSFPVTILRLFNVYGPYQNADYFIPQVINECVKNFTFSVSRCEQVRDFVYIDDVVSAIFLALTNPRTNGEIINIASGKKIMMKEVVEIIVKFVKKGNPNFGKIQYRKNENMKVYCNTHKAKKKLSWKSKINFSTGILKTIKHYKNIN
jgi:dTDP-glucose 4,6-dehydratase